MSGRQYSRSFAVPSASITRIVAGGNFFTPFSRVCGGGTTAWKVM